jgi:hypothetical protein
MTCQAVGQVFEMRDFYFLQERAPRPSAKIIARRRFASTEAEALFRLLVAKHARSDFREPAKTTR